MRAFPLFQSLVLAVTCVLTGSAVLAQTSPARGPLAAAEDIPMADYLALLRQIAPAAEDGARQYLALMQLHCAQAPTTEVLRRAISREGGDPVLMGLIRASQQQDMGARQRLARQFQCPSRTAP